MTQFLADENVPRAVVSALRDAGVDVAWIAESHTGADDEQVLTLAVSNGRVLVTFDKDFGEMNDTLQELKQRVLALTSPEKPSCSDGFTKIWTAYSRMQ